MAIGYVPLTSGDADQMYLPVESESVVGVVQLNRPMHDEEPTNGSYLIVPSDDQGDVSPRNRTFDLIGPLDTHARALTVFLGDRLKSMAEGQAALDGKPTRSAEGWGTPEHAARIMRVQFPNSYFRTHCLVYPLAEAHETFGQEIQIYLYENAGLQVGTLVGN